MNTKFLLAIGIAIIILVVGFFSLRQKGPVGQRTAAEKNSLVNQNQPTSSETDKIFELQLQDYNGKKVRLADFKGKPLVLNTWAAWCPFCRKELPDFAAAKEATGHKVEVIAINRAEKRDIAKKYSDELGVTDSYIFLLDPDDSFYRTIGGFSMPETLFIDSNGVIREHVRGPLELDAIRKKIEAIL